MDVHTKNPLIRAGWKTSTGSESSHSRTRVEQFRWWGEKDENEKYVVCFFDWVKSGDNKVGDG